MRSRLPSVLVSVMLCISIGLHWTALQTVAWVGMLATYSQESGSLVVGAQRTFDGEHPCPLCEMIAQGQAEEFGIAAVPTGSDDVPQPKRTSPEGHDAKLKLSQSKFLAAMGPGFAHRSMEAEIPPPSWFRWATQYAPEVPSPPPRWV